MYFGKFRERFCVVSALLFILSSVSAQRAPLDTSRNNFGLSKETPRILSGAWSSAEELSRHDMDTPGAFKLSQVKAGEAKALDTSPVDIHGYLDTVNGLVGILGGSSSSLVVGLTGISLTDCALSFKGVNTNYLSCEDFLDILSTCDALTNVKPLLKAAKKKLRYQQVPTNRPCSRKA